MEEDRLAAGLVEAAWVGDLHRLSAALRTAGIVAELGPVVGFDSLVACWGSEAQWGNGRNEEADGLDGEHFESDDCLLLSKSFREVMLIS